ARFVCGCPTSDSPASGCLSGHRSGAWLPCRAGTDLQRLPTRVDELAYETSCRAPLMGSLASLLASESASAPCRSRFCHPYSAAFDQPSEPHRGSTPRIAPPSRQLASKLP